MYNELDDTDDIDLTPDMSRAWGQVIRGLRESGEVLLHAACLDLKTVDYTRDTIEITCKDEALYQLLSKHKAKLEKYAGVGCVSLFRQAEQVKINKDVIDRLVMLFGDKLVIQKR